MSRFIDGLRGEGPLNVAEIMEFARGSLSPYAPFTSASVPKEPH